MKKALILLHRYLGIAISLLMAAWCVSGIVMMYVAFPAFADGERVDALPDLALPADCCQYETAAAAVGDGPIEELAVEMLGGRPVVRARDEYGTVVVSLSDGEIVQSVAAEEAAQVAAGYLAARGIPGVPAYLGPIEQDQWTVTAAYEAARPMHRFSVADAAETQLYVAGTHGELVLDTTATERFWNWFGAVTHWLYPTILRQNAAAWAQVVIWTSLIGTFLTVTGLWLGVWQIRAGRSGRFSPYRGFNLWHHVSGLVFGVLTLAWVASGLVSMAPFGWLSGSGPRGERQRLESLEFTSRDALASIERLTASAAALPADLVRIETAPLGGRLYLALRVRGARGPLRVDAASLDADVLDEAGLRAAAARLQPDVPIESQGLLADGDQYYYDDHDGTRAYPVYRVVLGDAERTRYYLDPYTGALRMRVDEDGRWYRWLFEAFHRWDFARGLRERPLWDLVVLPLMLGVTVLNMTGVVLGFRRVRPRRVSAHMR